MSSDDGDKYTPLEIEMKALMNRMRDMAGVKVAELPQSKEAVDMVVNHIEEEHITFLRIMRARTGMDFIILIKELLMHEIGKGKKINDR